MITTHEQVLTIIDRVTRCLIDKRVCPTSEKTPFFQHQHAPSLLRQIDSRSQPGESTPNNDHQIFVVRHNFTGCAMKRDYEINENNEINETFSTFRLFRYFRLFRNLSSQSPSHPFTQSD